MANDKNKNRVKVGDKVVYAYQAYSSGYIEIRIGTITRTTEKTILVDTCDKRLMSDRFMLISELTGGNHNG